MKKCSYKKEKLIRYLQNRMNREEESELQQHLLTCHVCANELKHLRIMIKELKKPRSSRKKFIIAAAIACSFAGGICLYQFQQTPENIAPASYPFEYNETPHHQDTDTLQNDSTPKKIDKQ